VGENSREVVVRSCLTNFKVKSTREVTMRSQRFHMWTRRAEKLPYTNRQAAIKHRAISWGIKKVKLQATCAFSKSLSCFVTECTRPVTSLASVPRWFAVISYHLIVNNPDSNRSFPVRSEPILPGRLRSGSCGVRARWACR
jgi:hypothetical protein